jgi:hypothetical protein
VVVGDLGDCGQTVRVEHVVDAVAHGVVLRAEGAAPVERQVGGVDRLVGIIGARDRHLVGRMGDTVERAVRVERQLRDREQIAAHRVLGHELGDAHRRCIGT